MGKKEVTLFERLKHEGARSFFDDHPLKPTGVIKDDLMKAVPFVVDASGLTTAMQLRNSLLKDQRFPLPDLALVPFETTWIEYDPRPKVTNPNDPFTSHVCGHLIWRTMGAKDPRNYPHPTSRFNKAMEQRTPVDGVCALTFEWHPASKTPLMLPFVFNWTKEDQYTAPWLHHVGSEGYIKEFSPETTDWMRKILLTGQDWLPTWKDRVGGDLFQPIPETDNYSEAELLGREVQRSIKESASMVSLLMGLLALIAWCPVEKVPTRHQGLWVSRRGAKPHINHTVVRVKIPIRKAYAQLKQAYKQSIIHKRRHKVREHFRVLHKGTQIEKVVLIHEHERGDISLGYCHQSYKVV